MEYLSVLEATETFGVSERTIRRLLKQWADEGRLAPDGAPAVRQTTRGTRPLSVLSRAALEQTLAQSPEAPTAGRQRKAGEGFEHGEGALVPLNPFAESPALLAELRAQIGFLQTQLQQKDAQLAARDAHIRDLTDTLNNFQERSDVLLKGLQDHLLELPAQLGPAKQHSRPKPEDANYTLAEGQQAPPHRTGFRHAASAGTPGARPRVPARTQFKGIGNKKRGV